MSDDTLTRHVLWRLPYFPPTSAASERVFSLLEAMFGKGHDASLADLIQAALMLRYNGRQVG